MCVAVHSRFSQAWQILVSHSANPLVDVIEVDQKELSMTFELLLVGFGFWLTMERLMRITVLADLEVMIKYILKYWKLCKSLKEGIDRTSKQDV